MGEIAYRCGFRTQSYFNVKFRERFGCSPREWGKSHASTLNSYIQRARTWYTERLVWMDDTITRMDISTHVKAVPDVAGRHAPLYYNLQGDCTDHTSQRNQHRCR